MCFILNRTLVPGALRQRTDEDNNMTTFRVRDIFILGFLNFALFVGAGNIIFPPLIGLQAGTSVWFAAMGFLLTGVGLPVITAIAMAKAGGSLSAITRPTGRICGMALTLACYLCIGPIFAIPRTATVSYELALQHYHVNKSGLPLWSLIFFSLVILVSLYPGRLLDTVGKFLSPLKIIALLVLTVTAVLIPAGAPMPPQGLYATSPFSQGITNGYLTMDTLAALVFGLVIVRAIQSRGVTSPRLITRYALYSGLIAGVGLVVVYAGLFRLGLSSSGLIEGATNGAQVISAYVHFSYGAAGDIFLGVLMTLACLVTAIGLTSACGSWFSDHTRFSYRTCIWFFAIVSMLISNIGLTQLINLSVPVLTAIYPVFVVLILTFFFREKLHSTTLVIIPAAFVTFLFGLAEALNSSGGPRWLASLTASMPLHNQGLAWLLPAASIVFVMSIIDHVRYKRESR